MGNGCNVPEEAVRECTKWIHDHIDQQDGICVVHCTHGYNRTGLIVCAYLTEYCGLSLNDAVKLFKEKRPSVKLLNRSVINRVFIDLKFLHN